MGRSYNLLPFIEPSRRCVHCQRRVGCQGRGLCRRCHNDLGIRNQYKPIVDTRPLIYLPSRETIEREKSLIRKGTGT